MNTSCPIPSWISEELQYLELPDKRLEKRAKIIISDQYANPDKTMYAGASDEASAKGAYRFQNNAGVNDGDLLKAHYKKAMERAKSFSVVLGVHDTSELNFTTQPQKENTGTLHTKKSRGFLLHPLVLFSPDKLCLGSVDVNLWSRDPEEFGKSKKRLDRPIEEKESYRWPLSYPEYFMKTYKNRPLYQARQGFEGKYPELQFVSQNGLNEQLI